MLGVRFRHPDGDVMLYRSLKICNATRCDAMRCDAMQVGVKAAIRIEDEVKS